MKQKLSESIDDYLDHARSLGLAIGTIRSREVTLRKFLTITGNIMASNVHEGHVDEYFRQVSATRSARTRSLDTSILKGFFKWAHRTRRLGRNGDPIAGRKAPRFAPREWRGVFVTKFAALLDAALHPRDRMLLALGLFLLGRSNEFTGLRISDVNLDAGEITYRIPKSYKVDILPISEELDYELRQWLKYYTEECGPLDPNWFLIPAKTRPSIGTGDRRPVVGSGKLKPTVRMSHTHRIAQVALEAIGYPIRDADGKSRHEGMHTLRRSAARALAEQLRDEGDPNPVETVRAILNHSTEAQTRVYIGWESSREHRNARIKGRPMFPGLRADNVTQLDQVRQLRAVES